MDTLFLSIENEICRLCTKFMKFLFTKIPRKIFLVLGYQLKTKKQGFDEANVECGYEGHDMDNG